MGASPTTTKLNFELGHATHTGLLRAQNEDSFCALFIDSAQNNARHKPVLVAVADGMGGEEAGEVASSMAVRRLVDQMGRHFAGSPVLSTAWIKSTVADVNAVVAAEAAQRGHVMGTTLVFALVQNGIAYLANVGDSRIYRWRTGTNELLRVVKDHSLVQLLVDEGIIDDEDRYSHPRRNYVTRSLGDPNTGLSDDNPALTLQSGDWLLLCSDGLWEMVRDEAILNVLRSAKSAQAACDTLVEKANANGGEDNITVVIARAK